MEARVEESKRTPSRSKPTCSHGGEKPTTRLFSESARKAQARSRRTLLSYDDRANEANEDHHGATSTFIR